MSYYIRFPSTYLIQAQDGLSAWFDLHVCLPHEIIKFSRPGTMSSSSLCITIFWREGRIILAEGKRIHLDSRISSLKKPGYQLIYKKWQLMPTSQAYRYEVGCKVTMYSLCGLHSDGKINLVNILSAITMIALFSSFCSSGCVLLTAWRWKARSSCSCSIIWEFLKDSLSQIISSLFYALCLQILYF